MLWGLGGVHLCAWRLQLRVGGSGIRRYPPRRTVAMDDLSCHLITHLVVSVLVYKTALGA